MLLQAQMALLVKSGADTTPRPNMTGNSSPAGYVASASAESFAQPYLAFDGVTGGTNYWGMSTDVGFLQILFPTDRMVVGYSIANRDNANQHPTAWQLQGSPDGATWTTVDTRTGQTGFAANEVRAYQVASPGLFRYYRLNITDNSANATIAIVSELNFSFDQ